MVAQEVALGEGVGQALVLLALSSCEQGGMEGSAGMEHMHWRGWGGWGGQGVEPLAKSHNNNLQVQQGLTLCLGCLL